MSAFNAFNDSGFNAFIDSGFNARGALEGYITICGDLFTPTHHVRRYADDEFATLAWTYHAGNSAKSVATLPDGYGVIAIVRSTAWKADAAGSAGPGAFATILGLDAFGTVLWHYDTGGSGAWVRLDADGNAYLAHARSGSVSLTSLDRDGVLRWTFDTGANAVDLWLDRSSGRIYVRSPGASGGPLRAVSTSGSGIWQGGDAFAAGPFGGMSGDSTGVYSGSSTMGKHSIADGSRLWLTRAGQTGFCGEPGGGVTCVGPARTDWQQTPTTAGDGSSKNVFKLSSSGTMLDTALVGSGILQGLTKFKGRYYVGERAVAGAATARILNGSLGVDASASVPGGVLDIAVTEKAH